jgi:YbgC/YbaW family acyl-CoA thioester hydrolase
VTDFPARPPDAFVHEVQMRMSDIDLAQHVNNARYLSYIEDARVAFLRRIGMPVGDPELGRVLAHAEVDFIQPIGFDPEPVQVAVWVARIGSRAFTLCYQICHHGTVRATARTVMVSFDPRVGLARPMQEHERTALEAALAGTSADGPSS